MKKRWILIAFILFIISCSKQNIEDCALYSTSEARNACITTAALEKREISICSNEYCYERLWTELDDKSNCLKIPENEAKDKCFMYFASSKGDYSSCGGISDLNKRENCYFQIGTEKQQGESCTRISNEQMKERCINRLKLKTVEVCSSMSNLSVRDNCISEGAVEKRDLGMCSSASDQAKDNCLKQVKGVLPG